MGGILPSIAALRGTSVQRCLGSERRLPRPKISFSLSSAEVRVEAWVGVRVEAGVSGRSGWAKSVLGKANEYGLANPLAS